MKKSRGFILYEVVLHLLLSTICFSVIYNEIFFTKKVSHQEKLEAISWHSSVIRLEEILDGATVKGCKGTSISLISSPKYKHPNKSYALEFYDKGHMIRVRGLLEGHMPIIKNVTKSEFEYKNKILTVKVVRRNEKVYEYVHKI